MWYFVGRGRDSIISPFIKEHYAFPNIVVSEGSYVDYSHQQLWGIIVPPLWLGSRLENNQSQFVRHNFIKTLMI